MTTLPSIFKWKKLSYKDYDKIKTFFSKFYTPHEPSRVMAGLTQSEIELIDTFRLKRRLQHEASVGIIEKSSNRLICCAMSSVYSDKFPLQDVDPQEVDQLPEKYLALLRMYALAEERKPNPEFLKGVKLFDVAMGLIDPEFRKFGLTKMTFKKAEEVAAEQDCKYMVVKATSAFVQQSLPSLGYSKFNEFKYADFMDPKTGLRPFTNAKPPHTHMKCYYKKVSPCICFARGS